MVPCIITATWCHHPSQDGTIRGKFDLNNGLLIALKGIGIKSDVGTRANITFNADSFKGNKQTIIQVKLAPDGAILTRVMTSSSGDNAWDQAVLSAIDATQSLPKDDNGQFPTLTPELKLKPK